MPEVVRTEDGNACGFARPRDGRAESVGRRSGEQRSLDAAAPTATRRRMMFSPSLARTT